MAGSAVATMVWSTTARNIGSMMEGKTVQEQPAGRGFLWKIVLHASRGRGSDASLYAAEGIAEPACTAEVSFTKRKSRAIPRRAYRQARMRPQLARKRMVTVNDRMQRGYRYELVAPAGRDFDPEFQPELTPKEMLRARRLRRQVHDRLPGRVPGDWFERRQALAAAATTATLNYFGVNATQPLSEWRRKGWIHPDDPRGWFQWYCRYYMGRRCPTTTRARSSAGRRSAATSRQIKQQLRAGRPVLPPPPAPGAAALGLRQPEDLRVVACRQRGGQGGTHELESRARGGRVGSRRLRRPEAFRGRGRLRGDRRLPPPSRRDLRRAVHRRRPDGSARVCRGVRRPRERHPRRLRRPLRAAGPRCGLARCRADRRQRPHAAQPDGAAREAPPTASPMSRCCRAPRPTAACAADEVSRARGPLGDARASPTSTGTRRITCASRSAGQGWCFSHLPPRADRRLLAR